MLAPVPSMELESEIVPTGNPDSDKKQRALEAALLIRHPVPPEGRTRRHERWCGDAVDALAAQDERRVKRTAKPCGPDAPTLASSS